ncbi:MAG TPA: ABC transporter permease [Gammaproteobacteria bacterium]|nr:ABC transporter permease [Gammaproteobacteria bacterium]
MTAPSFVKFDSGAKQVNCQGEWILRQLSLLKAEFEKTSWPHSGKLCINGSSISKMDSAGAWLLIKWLKKLETQGLQVQLEQFSAQTQKLLDYIQKKMETFTSPPRIHSPYWLTQLGKLSYQQLIEIRDYLSFVGKLALESLRLFIHPGYFRLSSVVDIIDKAGYRALGIIALLSFMIGVVIAYQMGFQLRNYGANVFIVNLLGLSILREFGPLLSAIMVAGRTGSSFTAQLGIMKINQEIDALDTMGVTPEQLLLLPRLAGLFIALPLLTMWADIWGTIGGMIMANNMLGVTPHDFLDRFQREIPLRSLIIGLGKAPIFALLIASIGCFQGIQVEGSAESVGTKTTRSVVLGIFFIIVADALFSVIFSKLRL